MTVYVFGAGASHHAGYPLAGELWNQIRAWVRGGGPECDRYRDGIEELNHLYGDQANFEEMLTELDDCPPGSRAAALNKTLLGLLRSNIRNCLPEYFNVIRQGPALLYDQFARERVRAGDLIITFNYDLACERALRTAGKWEISDGYGFQLATNVVPTSKVRVLKLHGSTDWVWLVSPGLKPGVGVQIYTDSLSNTPVIRSYNDLEYFGYPAEVFDRLMPSTFGGAITAALMGHKRFYMKTSLGYEGAEFWADLWALAAGAVQSADSIVIIGYSMPTADIEARRLLFEQSNKDADVSIWSGRTTKRLSDEFRSHGFTHVETHTEGHFQDFLVKPPGTQDSTSHL